MRSSTEVLILVNPKAGNGRGILWLKGLAERVKGLGLQDAVSVASTWGGALADQLRQMATEKHRIVVVGGDGTVSQVIGAIHELGLSIPVGIVPLGTGNDLARSLGLYTGRPWCMEEAMGYALRSGRSAVDLWSINEVRTFNNYLSVGLDATVVRGFSRIRKWIADHPPLGGRAMYFAVYLMVWLRQVAQRVPAGCRLLWTDARGRRWSMALGKPRVVTMTSAPYYAAGTLIDPHASYRDGLLEITIFSNMYQYGELMAMRVPAFAHRGIQRRWWRVRARSATLILSQPSCVQADGEDLTDLLGKDLTLDIRHMGQVGILVWGAQSPTGADGVATPEV